MRDDYEGRDGEDKKTHHDHRLQKTSILIMMLSLITSPELKTVRILKELQDQLFLYFSQTSLCLHPSLLLSSQVTL